MSKVNLEKAMKSETLETILKRVVSDLGYEVSPEDKFRTTYTITKTGAVEKTDTNTGTVLNVYLTKLLSTNLLYSIFFEKNEEGIKEIWITPSSVLFADISRAEIEKYLNALSKYL